MKKQHYMTRDERCQLEAMHRNMISVAEIARQLGFRLDEQLPAQGSWLAMPGRLPRIAPSSFSLSAKFYRRRTARRAVTVSAH